MLLTNVIDSLKPDLKIILADPVLGAPAQIQDRGEVMLFGKVNAAEMNLVINRSAQAELGENHHRAIREELQKLLRSSLLIQSDRLSRFLAFAVESTLDGKADCIKEYTIGTEAYGRGSDFDPSQDSIVRTEARRLRTKLSKYYQEEGIDDPIVIEIHPGSYVPSFRLNQAVTSRIIEHRQAPKSAHRAIAVLPVAHLAGDSFGEACARGLTDEILHRLTRTVGFNVFTSSVLHSEASTNGQNHREIPCWLTSEGIVRTEGNLIRVTSRLSGADGLNIASWRFDTERKPEGLFSELERIASEIVACIDQHKMMQVGG